MKKYILFLFLFVSGFLHGQDDDLIQLTRNGSPFILQVDEIQRMYPNSSGGSVLHVVGGRTNYIVEENVASIMSEACSQFIVVTEAVTNGHQRNNRQIGLNKSVINTIVVSGARSVITTRFSTLKWIVYEDLATIVTQFSGCGGGAGATTNVLDLTGSTLTSTVNGVSSDVQLNDQTVVTSVPLVVGGVNYPPGTTIEDILTNINNEVINKPNGVDDTPSLDLNIDGNGDITGTLIVSGDAGNTLTFGSDGGVFVPSPDAVVYYKNDAAAAAGGVLLDEPYILDEGNPYGQPKGSERRRQ